MSSINTISVWFENCETAVFPADEVILNTDGITKNLSYADGRLDKSMTCKHARLDINLDWVLAQKTAFDDQLINRLAYDDIVGITYTDNDGDHDIYVPWGDDANNDAHNTYEHSFFSDGLYRNGEVIDEKMRWVCLDFYADEDAHIYQTEMSVETPDDAVDFTEATPEDLYGYQSSSNKLKAILDSIDDHRPANSLDTTDLDKNIEAKKREVEKSLKAIADKLVETIMQGKEGKDNG